MQRSPDTSPGPGELPRKGLYAVEPAPEKLPEPTTAIGNTLRSFQSDLKTIAELLESATEGQALLAARARLLRRYLTEFVQAFPVTLLEGTDPRKVNQEQQTVLELIRLVRDVVPAIVITLSEHACSISGESRQALNGLRAYLLETFLPWLQGRNEQINIRYSPEITPGDGMA